MKVTLIKEYWVLGDREREYFLSVNGEYCDWTSKIDDATKFPSEYGAIMYNKARNFELVAKDEVEPISVSNTYTY